MKQLLFIPVLFFLFLNCSSQNSSTSISSLQSISGNTMGTTYSIKYYGENSNLKYGIDSLLLAINESVSTYIPTSTISKVNQTAGGTTKVDQHFINNFNTAKKIHQITTGSFNPAIMPLVNYWGFGYERLKDNTLDIDSSLVARLLLITDFDDFVLNGSEIEKKNANGELDFSALAKGYGVDQVGEYLQSQGVNSYLVEIGGETVAHGKKENGNSWKIGIRKPTINMAERNELITAFDLDNAAMATSGNYEIFKVLDENLTIAHTINPVTGFPQKIEEEILSSTVITSTCIVADAYATAFKVMGLEKSIIILKNLPELKAYFVYRDSEGELTSWSNFNLESGEHQ